MGEGVDDDVDKCYDTSYRVEDDAFLFVDVVALLNNKKSYFWRESCRDSGG